MFIRAAVSMQKEPEMIGRPESDRDLTDIRALIFDVFGTVVDWRSGVVEALRRELGVQVPAGAMADSWRGRYLPSMDRVRKGEIPWTNLDDLHYASLKEVLREFEVRDVEEQACSALVQSWHHLEPWPDAIAGLSLLKRDRTIGTLSNGNMSLLIDMAKHAGLPWDVIFSAEIFRHFKPDRETYEGAVEMLGLRPHQVMMVAAHVEDLAAAKASGLRTAYVHRPLEKGPDMPQPPETDPNSDLTVRSISELAEAIGER